MNSEDLKNDEKLKKAGRIAFTVVNIFLICLLSGLMIAFFCEKVRGGDAWTNIGMIFCAEFLALPVLGIMPVWIILLKSKKKSLLNIVIYSLTLVLLCICFVLGWVYSN